MHRLKTLIAATALLLPVAIIACGGGNKKPAKTSHDDSSEDGGAGETTSADGADGGGSECTGFEEPKLEEALMKSPCEMKDMTAGQGAVDMKDKLEIRVMPFPTKVAPGAIMEILVSFVNKSKEPLTLYFQINPEPHFTIEAYDAKNKRVDMPSGNPPPFPKDMVQPQGAEPKIAKYGLQDEVGAGEGEGRDPGSRLPAHPLRAAREGQVHAARDHAAGRRVRGRGARGQRAEDPDRGQLGMQSDQRERRMQPGEFRATEGSG
jgi:hypothetical protein